MYYGIFMIMLSKIYVLHGINVFVVLWLFHTHTALLGPIMGCVHISLRFVKRFCKFIDTMYKSSNKIVKYFYLNACYSAQSPIGRNLAMMRFKYGLSININSNGSLHDVFVYKYMCQNNNNHK